MKKIYTSEEIRHEKMINTKIENTFFKKAIKDGRTILDCLTNEDNRIDTIFTKTQLQSYIDKIREYETTREKPSMLDLKFYQELFNRVIDDTGHSDLEVYLMFIYLDLNHAIKTKEYKEFKKERLLEDTKITHIPYFDEEIDIALGIEAKRWQYPISKWKEVQLLLKSNPSLNDASERLKIHKLDVALMAIDMVYNDEDVKCYWIMNQILWDSIR